MIRTIIQNGFDADYRISSQRAFLYAFLDPRIRAQYKTVKG